MPSPFTTDFPVTFLAPMQDITDAPFMRIFSDLGCPDFFIAEYFRIHEYYELEPHIIESILSRPCGRSVGAQFIGEDEYYISKAISEIHEKYPQITMLDLNLGCPAPKVYRKNVGGGLLRDVEKIKSIVKLMRGEWGGVFSVKMRSGFESDIEFPRLLDAVLEGAPDFITVHARTVRQLYRGEPNYEIISYAVKNCDIPIIANGDISSASKALSVIGRTKCAGVMCGRGAVRNPWIFRQISETLAGKTVFKPTLGDVRIYIDRLLQNAIGAGMRIEHIDSRLKKFLNFVGICVDSDGEFLFAMRRARGLDELMSVCDRFLSAGGNSEKLFADEPYAGLCSRPNHEGVL